MKIESQSRDSLHLALGTISFTLCFAAWGLISAFAPQFRKPFGLTLTQSAALVGAPVLLGSLARIPMGMLTDRIGGRFVFAGLMAISAIPTFLSHWPEVFIDCRLLASFLVWLDRPLPWEWATSPAGPTAIVDMLTGEHTSLNIPRS